MCSALQCRLECEPGYVAQRTPLITCVNGEYAQGCHYLQKISKNLPTLELHSASINKLTLTNVRLSPEKGNVPVSLTQFNLKFTKLGYNAY